MDRLFKTFFAVGAVVGVSLCAAAGHDLPINGDFRGAPGRRMSIPGWSFPARGVRLIPRHKGKHTLELFATPGAPNAAASELHPTGPGTLEVKADMNGRGIGSLGFEAYDASRSRIVQSGRQDWRLTDVPARVKFNFRLSDPSIAYVRITLTAEAGSVVNFYDVDAEMHYAPAPVPPPVPAPAPAVAPQPLAHHGTYHLSTLPPVSVFHTAVYPGRDIEFKLTEHRGRMWTLASGYDPRVCRVEMEHKFKRGTAYLKVELKAVYRGVTNVEFVNNDGKRVIVQFTAL